MAPHASEETHLPVASGSPKSAGLVHGPDSKLTDLEKSELALADKFSSPDVYINGETDTCWHPWHNNLELKPLRFETRTGTFVVVLRSTEDTWLGKHRHRGTVTAVTVKGEWYYKELSASRHLCEYQASPANYDGEDTTGSQSQETTWWRIRE